MTQPFVAGEEREVRQSAARDGAVPADRHRPVQLVARSGGALIAAEPWQGSDLRARALPGFEVSLDDELFVGAYHERAGHLELGGQNARRREGRAGWKRSARDGLPQS